MTALHTLGILSTSFTWNAFPTVLKDFPHMIHAVSSEQLMLRCVCYFIWAAIYEAGNSNELILCSRGNSGSFFPVAVLVRASFIIALDGFCECTWENFQSSWNFPDWLSFMSESNDGLSFLFAYLSCSCHNMDLVFYQIGLSSVYHPYLVTTQLLGSNALKEKKCTTFIKAHLLIEMHSRWLSHEAGWENAKSVQSWHQGKVWIL